MVLAMAGEEVAVGRMDLLMAVLFRLEEKTMLHATVWYFYGFVWYCAHGMVQQIILNVKSPHYVQKGRSYTLMAYKEGHAEKRINYYSSPSGLQK